MGGIAGALGIGQGMSISGSIGGAYSTSSGHRSVESDTVQQLSDRIVQSSTAIRNLQSTVIVSGTQQEREVIQTRTVTNHNHCHAVTVMYYEVLRHFKVVTEWVNKKDVLLIQCPLVTFNEGTAMANRLVLERVLLDPLTTGVLCRLLVKKHCFDLGIIATTPPSSGDDHFLEGLTIVVATGEHDPGGTFFLKLDKKSGADYLSRGLSASGSPSWGAAS